MKLYFKLFCLMIVLIPFIRGNAQCSYQFNLHDGISTDKEYILALFSIKGVKGSEANKIANSITLYRGDKVIFSTVYMNQKLSAGCTLRKKYLSVIEAYKTNDSTGQVVIKLIYEGQKTKR